MICGDLSEHPSTRSRTLKGEPMTMKNCPFCAEEIQEAAIKCKHCGEMLEKHVPAELGNASSPSSSNSVPLLALGTLLLLGLLAIAGTFLSGSSERTTSESTPERGTDSNVAVPGTREPTGAAASDQDQTRKLDECRKNLHDIGTALERWSTEHGGEYPHTLSDLGPFAPASPSCPASPSSAYHFESRNNPPAYGVACMSGVHPHLQPGYPQYTSERGLVDPTWGPDDVERMIRPQQGSQQQEGHPISAPEAATLSACLNNVPSRTPAFQLAFSKYGGVDYMRFIDDEALYFTSSGDVDGKYTQSTWIWNFNNSRWPAAVQDQKQYAVSGNPNTFFSSGTSNTIAGGISGGILFCPWRLGLNEQRQLGNLASQSIQHEIWVVRSDDMEVAFRLLDSPPEFRNGMGGNSIAVASSGKWVASSGNTGQIKIWQAPERPDVSGPSCSVPGLVSLFR